MKISGHYQTLVKSITLLMISLMCTMNSTRAFAQNQESNSKQPAAQKKSAAENAEIKKTDKPAPQKNAPAKKTKQPAEQNAKDKPAPSKQADVKKTANKKPGTKQAADKKSDKKKSEKKPDTKNTDSAPKAEPYKPHPATVIPKADASYALMGEYTGAISLEENKSTQLALQIRPVGNNLFEARQFEGGLPGQKMHKPQATKLIGIRSGEFVVLSGAPWAIFAEKEYCLVLNRAGKQIGRLQRVARQSPTLGAKPPKESIILFNGKDTKNFTTAEMTPDGLLMEGADLNLMFQDFNLHLEFYLPYMPTSSGQARGNSGVYLQSRYEVQVLDSFAQDRLINGCGALYKQRKPDLNMCLPPLQWQTYDIEFTAPRWAADGSKVRNAYITVWLNGVKVQNNVELKAKTGAGKIEEPLLLPTRFQNHRDPVRFRNIWLIDRGLASKVNFPVLSKPGNQKQVVENKPETKPGKPEPKPVEAGK